MRKSLRLIAAFFVMLILPVQGLAAACAQICIKSHLAAELAGSDDVVPAHHCDEPAGGSNAGGEGKCCFAHAFLMNSPVTCIAVAVPSLDPPRFVPRWSSHIPEEPSPPPILARAA